MNDTELLFDDLYEPPNSDPFLVVLSYSAGQQSHRIARGILRGEIKKPKRLLVISADPGDEHCNTIRIRDRTLKEFNDAGIHAVIAPGPKMRDDLRTQLESGAQRRSIGKVPRVDNSAYWTESGGRLPQKCTAHYKLAPMRRVMRAYLLHAHGIKIPSPRSVEQWIGFAWDERHRIKAPDVKYEQFRYPLIDLRETKQDIMDWYKKTGEEIPPPSVCNHCWANGVATFKRIHDTDPDGWKRAVEFDEMSRDLSSMMIKEKLYCSRTLIPLKELAERNFEITGRDAKELSCDSGVCFI